MELYKELCKVVVGADTMNTVLLEGHIVGLEDIVDTDLDRLGVGKVEVVDLDLGVADKVVVPMGMHCFCYYEVLNA